MKRIVVTGSIAFDEIMTFPGVFSDYIKPEKIHQLNVSFIVDTLEKQLGGTALNITYNIELLSPGKALLLSTVGKDNQQVLNWLNENRINTDGVKVTNDHYTATGKAITDMDDNQIWGFHPGATKAAVTIDPSRYVNSDDVLIISSNHIDSFLHFQNHAISKKIRYMYDPGMMLTMISSNDLKKGVQNCTWLIANDYEMDRIFDITGLNVNDLIAGGMKIITTLGSKGVHYVDNDNVIDVPGYEVAKIIDPTGAGDAWRGGFITGILNGMKTHEALVQGNAIASFAVEKHGTTNHTPSIDEVRTRMDAINDLL